MHPNGSFLAFALFCLLSVSAANAEEPATPPAEEGFFSKLADAVKKGVTEGAQNGVLMAGSVKVLGYTMIYSKMHHGDQPAFCLAAADTGKLITGVPVFGRPYQRSDGTTGFMQATKEVDRNHVMIEVNVLHVLPGLNCADLISKHQLNAYGASERANSGGTSEKGIPGKMTSASELEFADCYGRYLEPAEKAQMSKSKTWREGDGHKLCLNRLTGRPEKVLNFSTHHFEVLPKGFSTVSGTRADGSFALSENVQAGWDKVDRIQREGVAKIEADGAARDSANSEKSIMRQAAFEKCRPLIQGDNSKMEAFKTCFNNAIK